MPDHTSNPERSSFLESLFEGFPDAIIVLSAVGTVMYWNKRAEEIFGYERSEVENRTLSSVIVPPNRVQEEQDQFQQALHSGFSSFESERRCKDRSLVHIYASYRVDRQADGKIKNVVTTHKDVTHLKVLNDSRLLDARYRGLLESTPDAIIIANQTGHIVLINEQAVRMFKYDRQVLTGQRVEILLPERFHSSHLGHRAAFMAQPRQRSMGAGLELFGRRSDGEEFPVEISLSPLEIDGGLFVMSAIRDVADRKRADRKFKALLESAPDAIVIVDQQGSITLLNTQAQKLFGYSSEELLGQKIEVLVPAKYRDNHPGHRSAFSADPKVRPMGAGLELFGLHKDGSEFPVEISLSPLETEEGSFVMSAIRNVSDRKRVEQALQRANSELEAFAYSVSHDLRAPLRTVDGFSLAVLEDYASILPDEGAKYLQLIREGAQKMGQLIDDLLEFSRLGRQSISRRQIDVNQLVGEVIESLAELRRDRAVKINAAKLPPCSGDLALTRQVWQNLISNALKYSRGRTPAVIEIGSTIENNATIYFVRDNGTGFNMKYYEKLFGVFQRLHRSEDFEGTGVGLAIVHRVLDRHGGKIWAEAVPDKGATFYFTLEEGAGP